METVNLYIMDMSDADNTNGVDRYISELLGGLEQYPKINICWIHLLHDHCPLLVKEEDCGHYRKVTIPLPQSADIIIAHNYWMDKYNQIVFHHIKHLFKDKTNCILHLNTLNLIDLALAIKKHIHCKIISHLHCIPWKGYYNRDILRFNQLHRENLHAGYSGKTEQFITSECELICVTKLAQGFVKAVSPSKNNRVLYVPNGMKDHLCSRIPSRVSNGEVKFIYVGTLSKSKGLHFILEALQRVQKKGYMVSLTVAGKNAGYDLAAIKKEFSSLSLNILGVVPFHELQSHYRECDIGIIASLQEQTSYVAIEMAMFGMPIITTAVDGLDEMFTDKLNALKVGTKFSKVRGLSVDVEMMEQKILMLANAPDRRKKLSINARKLYENNFTVSKMTDRTVAIYEQLINRN